MTYDKYALLFDDARQSLQMGSEAISRHCLNTYRSAFIWIPKRSLLRQKYGTSFCNVPGAKVLVGLADAWELTSEHVMRHRGTVTSVMFSDDGRRVVSGSEDRSVR